MEESNLSELFSHCILLFLPVFFVLVFCFLLFFFAILFSVIHNNIII